MLGEADAVRVQVDVDDVVVDVAFCHVGVEESLLPVLLNIV